MDAYEAAKKSSLDDDGLFERLQPIKAPVNDEALRVNKENVDQVSKDKDEETEDISAAGRTKVPVVRTKEEQAKPAQKQLEKPDKPEDDEDDSETKAELNMILKRSPIIIFSKSYCPYSAKAKSILLEKYSITPLPFVVELDKHPTGRKLQDLLSKNTGRTTVPNILINGRSIGGGDDVAALDTKNELVEKIKTLGGKRIMEVTLQAEKET
jgi:glutaredoxin